MPNYKLTYFNSKGMGELPRYVLFHSGIPFEDNRITKEQWPELKPTMPFARMPVLEEDGVQVSGGRVIARYLGEKPEFNLAGSNPLENAQIASVGDFLDDLQHEIIKAHMEKDAERKAAIVKDFLENGVPKYYGTLHKRLEDNGGYLWGGKLTWVDFYFAVLLDFVYDHFKDVFQKFPKIIEFKEKIEALPNIAKYLKERPEN